MIDLIAHDRASLEALLAEWGEAPSHATRLLRHYYATHAAPDWASLPISRTLKARLIQGVAPLAVEVLERVESADGTVKLLIGCRRGGAVEAVLMPSYRDGEASCCVSSQVGCAMACDFCASTRSGLERNLEVDEIVGQFVLLGAEAAARGRALRRLVFMGTGEPLANLPNVRGAIDRIARPEMGALGWRRITVSTVGVVPGMDALAEARLGVFLAVSLHAPDDATRTRIVPMTKAYKVADIMAAARRFQAQTKRVVTISYTLMNGVNDALEQADALADLMEGFRAHVNLIPYNAIGAGLSGATYGPPPVERVEGFVAHLRDRGVVAHVRDVRGDDVSAACGQLRERSAISAGS